MNVLMDVDGACVSFVISYEILYFCSQKKMA